jgi:FMN-dependent NADH-azoreductase
MRPLPSYRQPTLSSLGPRSTTSVFPQRKAWIDHIAHAGVTFRYTANGPEGLLKGKKVYVAMASGGVYSEGPMVAFDFVAPYLKTVFGFLGMTI